jgi:cell division septal protein FtsQ
MEIIIAIAVLYVVALFGTAFTLLIASRRPEKPAKEIVLQGNVQRQPTTVVTEVSH